MNSKKVWQENAACKGMDTNIFFPTRRYPSHRDTQPAKVICHACPVQAECLTEALRNREEYGIFGGLTASERQLLRLRIDRQGRWCWRD